MIMPILVGSADWNLWPISRDYDKIFSTLKSLGISYAELGIYEPSKELSKSNQVKILAAAERNGITISALLFSLTEEFWPSGAFSNLESEFIAESKFFLNALNAMNIKYANIWTGVDLPESSFAQVRKTLEELDALAIDFNGIVSIEYKTNTRFPDGRALATILSDFKYLKVLIDTGHAFALEENIVELIQDLDSRNLMGAMHLGDAVVGDSDADLPCGRVHDFLPIIKILNQINFSSSISFDLYGAATDELGPGPLSILDESATYMKRIIGNQ